jgi:hypothetical protein
MALLYSVRKISQKPQCFKIQTTTNFYATQRKIITIRQFRHLVYLSLWSLKIVKRVRFAIEKKKETTMFKAFNIELRRLSFAKLLLNVKICENLPTFVET